ncbi:hypothetical protein L195_g040614 [Trifolium pratense]|uniref:Uncharacterized protein n=1 Tax=Trifolium pratense TaxID=57577 RepID=A0A2K3M194_TRIPR|nr:hypothetical protein L195_g040614 [Trifolium pratense]
METPQRRGRKTSCQRRRSVLTSSGFSLLPIAVAVDRTVALPTKFNATTEPTNNWDKT